MASEIDIRENDILRQDPVLLEILLIDRSRPKNGSKKPQHIIWATDNYESRGPEYAETEQISIAAITGENGDLIQPRVRKTKEEQQSRARDKGEVFTPSWICNAQNNLVDNEWFGMDYPFNEEAGQGWKTKTAKVKFPTSKGFTWQDYVKDIRLEITCGEAPYLISRYDTISGKTIPVPDRIGLLDRKLRVAGENTVTEEEWYAAARQAYQATYGYEWQGDNLLLARENALYTFFDYYQDKFGKAPTKEQAREIAEIISWNLWQMDGLKGVIPNSCHDEVEEIPSLFGDSETIVKECPGCKEENHKKHNGIYCKIMNWESGRVERYIDSLKL